jgi:hypothetical protein
LVRRRGRSGPGEHQFQRLNAAANGAASTIERRTEHGQQVALHLPTRARIRDTQRRLYAAQKEVQDFAREHRAELEAEMSERALAAHLDLLDALDSLAKAAVRHRAAADAFGDVAIKATGRTASGIPNNAAELASRVRSEIETFPVPIPPHAINDDVVDALAERQPRLSQQLARKLDQAKARKAEGDRRREVREQKGLERERMEAKAAEAREKATRRRDRTNRAS